MTLVILCYGSVVIIIEVMKTSIHTSIIVGRGIDPLRLLISFLFIEGRCLTHSRNVVSYPRKSEFLNILKYLHHLNLCRLASITNLMHSSFLLQWYILHYNPRHVSSNTVLILRRSNFMLQLLLSSLSVSGRTVYGLRADCSPLSTSALSW